MGEVIYLTMCFILCLLTLNHLPVSIPCETTFGYHYFKSTEFLPKVPHSWLNVRNCRDTTTRALFSKVLLQYHQLSIFEATICLPPWVQRQLIQGCNKFIILIRSPRPFILASSTRRTWGVHIHICTKQQQIYMKWDKCKWDAIEAYLNKKKASIKVNK